jgi:hypothetical protein
LLREFVEEQAFFDRVCGLVYFRDLFLDKLDLLKCGGWGHRHLLIIMIKALIMAAVVAANPAQRKGE